VDDNHRERRELTIEIPTTKYQPESSLGEHLSKILSSLHIRVQDEIKETFADEFDVFYSNIEIVDPTITTLMNGKESVFQFSRSKESYSQVRRNTRR
jgi:hypothetical protein